MCEYGPVGSYVLEDCASQTHINTLCRESALTFSLVCLYMWFQSRHDEFDDSTVGARQTFRAAAAAAVLSRTKPPHADSLLCFHIRCGVFNVLSCNVLRKISL